VVIKYVDAGVATYATFNYTGADQTWTVPSGVTSASFHLLGAGGGGSDESDVTYKGGNGGGAGYAAGTYTVTAGQVYVVIVGQAGGGAASVDVGASVRGGGYREYRTPATYGGGGRGGSISNGDRWFDSERRSWRRYVGNGIGPYVRWWWRHRVGRR